MAGMFPRLAAIAAVLALGACELALPGGQAARPAAPDPVTGGAIEVTALAPAPTAGAPVAAAPAEAAAVHRPGPDTPRPRPRPEAATAPAAPTAAAAAPAVPEAQKSAARLACEKRKGRWVETGKGSAYGCVMPTKDAMKECTRSSQCEGSCLARSGTCAPYTPLFGCNEVLDDTGRRMTQCLD